MKVFPIVLAIILCGCASNKSGIKKSVERGPSGTIAYLVQVESNEPGVKIEANGDYIGDTPCTLKIFGDKDGTFHNFGQYDYVIRAFPLQPGQFEQTKTFRTGGWFRPEDRIPSRIYFDMNLRPGFAAGSGAAPTPAPASPPVDPQPSGMRKLGTATAFAITDDGYLLSNYHVIENAGRVIVVFPDERVEAKVVLVNERSIPQNVNYALKTSYASLLLQYVPDLLGKLPKPAELPARPFPELAELATLSVVLVEVYR